MSMWCPKCQNVTYNKKICDKCNHVIEDNSKSYKVPKTNKVKILKPKDKQTNNSYQDKKNKGDEYEIYIAKHYRSLGYTVIEHGKEKGRKDGGIDLIAEKNDEVILIQCKDWNENNSHKIDHKDIKVLRIDANDFLEKNPKYQNYKIKLKYTLSGNFIHNSAKKHMEECKEDIDYEIIKPNYREEQTRKNNYKKESFNSNYKNRTSNKQSFNTGYMKECEVCGKKIAVKATSCPHCGDIKSKNLFWKIIKIIAILIAALFILEVILTSIGIAIFSNALDNVNKELDKSNQTMIKQIKNIKPPIINFDNTYKSNINKDNSIRPLEKETHKGPLTRYITNTQTDKEKCNKKYWELQKQSNKYWWEKRKENQNIIKELNKRRIDYLTILKQRTKEVPINIQKLNEQSCSKNYFDLAYKRKKADNAIKQENDILKELARNNFIKIEKEKSLYKNNRAKEDLKKQMNF